MSNEIKTCTADLILTDAIEDYAARSNLSIDEIRDRIIDSGAYDALYDFETELWTQGPDYFIDFFLKKSQATKSNKI